MFAFLDVLAHFFIPRQSNNQKAKILHPSVLVVLLLVFAFYQVGLSFITKTGVGILGYASQIPPQEIVRITNEKRIANGAGALEFSPALSAAARRKGEHMLSNDYWAHVAPDGTEPWSFFLAEGYKYRYAGENLARDFTNPSSTVDAWMASPTHRDNLLSGKYKEIGVAVVEGELNGVETTIVVQMFGSRLLDTTPQLPIAQTQVQSETITRTTPTPTVAANLIAEGDGTSLVASQEVLPSESEDPSRFISPFLATQKASTVTLTMLLGAMVIDGVVAHDKKIARASGRMVAHVAFLFAVFVAVIMAQTGVIL